MITRVKVDVEYATKQYLDLTFWCEANCAGQFNFRVMAAGEIVFHNEHDALLFRLRWGK